MTGRCGGQLRAEETVMDTVNLELFYDFRSHRARVLWNDKEAVLPEPFRDREAAEAAAVRHVRAVLSLDDRRGALVPKIRIWLR